MRVFGVLCTALGVLSASCGVPRDADHTLERVEHGTLRAGVVHAPPWLFVDPGGEPRGIEADLIRGFATELGARVEWVARGESDLLRALEHRELDLVAAGLERDTPWKSKIALSQRFVRVSIVAATRPGGHAIDLERGVLAVRPHRRETALARERGARVVLSGQPQRAPDADAVVAYDFEADAWGLSGAREELTTEEHVLAVAPGENAFASRLGHFLVSRRGWVREHLAPEVVDDARADGR